MLDVVITVCLLAAVGFYVESHRGWRAGLENMVMSLLALATCFAMVALATGAVSFWLFNLGGWEAIRALDKV